MLYPYCALLFWYGKHSKDTTVLIDLLWFNIVYYSSLFQYFFQSYYGPYSIFLIL